MTTSRLLQSLNIAIVLFFLGTLLLAPIAVDRIHMDDTVLLANLGWRGVNGLAPVTDYPHFYGGIDAQFVTIAFKLFGVSYKSINYAFAMMFVVAAVVLWILTWRRIPGLEIALLVTLAAALIGSLDPLEEDLLLGVGHSFVYNHLGIVLMMGLMIFACKGLEDRRAEYLTAAIAGVALYGLTLLKTTFGVMLPYVVLACFVQRRWVSSLLVMAGAAVGMLFMDPGMTRASESLVFLLESAAATEAGSLKVRLAHALRMTIDQAALLAICVFLAIFVLRKVGRSSLTFFLAAIFCGAGYGAAVLSMGGEPGLKLVPFLTVFTLLMTDRLAGERARRPGDATFSLPELPLMRALPFCMAYALILPAMMTSAFGLRVAVQYSGASLVADGPFTGYFVYGSATRIPEIHVTGAEERRAAAVVKASEDLEAGLLDESHEYVLFADGIALLQQIPDVASYGIISNGRMFDFTMPLGSAVVPSYPVWPTFGLPGLADPSRLGSDVDIVMMLDAIPALGLVTRDLQMLMGEEFRVCRRSEFWTLFARRTLPDSLCVPVPPSAD